GANPTQTHPVLAKHIIHAKYDSGAKLIVVDPRFTVLASKADLWLQVRPGTDAALALGMLNVIINEELYDKEFVERWCIGFEELRKRVKEYPPEKVAEITRVPAELIKEAARMYATIKPACLYARTALEGLHNTGQTLRALNMLIAVTGNFDVKGGNRAPTLPKGYMSDIEVAKDPKYRPPKEVEEIRIGAKEFPLLSGPLSARPCAHITLLQRAILTGKPYPIKALYGVANMIAAHENTNETIEALKKLEFMVLMDFFMTPSTEFADIVLPAATRVEVDDIADRYPNFIRVRQKAIEP
ncbi:MAG: molybdopterin-dependent oxidoreductase, partial [Candidatus Bathyarchaeia archaeon]